MNVQFDFQTTGQEHADPFLDSYDLTLLFEQTKQDLGSAITRKLEGMSCVEHGKEPAIMVRAIYDLEREQMEVSYGVDTCCPMFMVRVVQILHRIG